ncbi:response regulator [Gramella jeungdoensis]|uniref:Response regulator n=1 Tax=Gramella jeungdoensis TaxID=708091 RepID=A0ABT0Z250_9FLAO|nr:response regulator [Gramella jeungdoensis]MCM8569811.1 response regulator [Gramella jeungdoensis]
MQIERIFLVDDEAIINAIQTKIVNRHFSNLQISKFSSAEEVLKILPQIDYKPLIFLDLNMPIMDAIDFLKRLEMLQLKVYPVIYILTYSQNPEELEFVKNHSLVRNVLFKPLDEEKINLIKKEQQL